MIWIKTVVLANKSICSSKAFWWGENFELWNIQSNWSEFTHWIWETKWMRGEWRAAEKRRLWFICLLLIISVFLRPEKSASYCLQNIIPAISRLKLTKCSLVEIKVLLQKNRSKTNWTHTHHTLFTGKLWFCSYIVLLIPSLTLTLTNPQNETSSLALINQAV